MPRETREEERLTEDEIARRKLGPRGVPGGQDFAKMTPQREKNIPTITLQCLFHQTFSLVAHRLF